MDVPLKQNGIGIRSRFKGYERKSSTSCQQTGVVGLSALYQLEFIRVYQPTETKATNLLLRELYEQVILNI